MRYFAILIAAFLGAVFPEAVLAGVCGRDDRIRRSDPAEWGAFVRHYGPETARQAETATYRVYVDGIPAGSGVAITEEYFITAAHVVRRALREHRLITAQTLSGAVPVGLDPVAAVFDSSGDLQLLVRQEGRFSSFVAPDFGFPLTNRGPNDVYFSAGVPGYGKNLPLVSAGKWMARRIERDLLICPVETDVEFTDFVKALTEAEKEASWLDRLWWGAVADVSNVLLRHEDWALLKEQWSVRPLDRSLALKGLVYGSDATGGDSGGPLFRYDPRGTGSLHVVGVVSMSAWAHVPDRVANTAASPLYVLGLKLLAEKPELAECLGIPPVESRPPRS